MTPSETDELKTIVREAESNLATRIESIDQRLQQCQSTDELRTILRETASTLATRMELIDQRLQQCETAVNSEKKPVVISSGIGGDSWIATRFGLNGQDISRDSFWTGKAMKTCNFAAGAYLLVVVVAVFLYCLYGVHASTMNGSGRLVAFGLATLVSVSPPLFFWFEAKAFDVWVNHKYKDLEDQKSWRETYKLNADNGKAVWAAVLAAVAAALLIK